MLKKIMKKCLVGAMVFALGLPSVSIQGAYLEETDVKVSESIQEDMSIQSNEKETGIVSGTCGENVSYELNLDTGNVVIGGTGKMTDYKSYAESPFYAYNNQIRSVTIEEGITSVGAYMFALCLNLETVTLPQSLTTIGTHAFIGCVSMEFLSISENVTKIGSYALGYYLDSGKHGTYYRTNLVISGTSGSAVHTYANKNKINFIDPATLSYQCGSEIYWSFDMDTGILRISGNGYMLRYGESGVRPVFDCYKSQITSVVIEEGITNIGSYAFNGYEKITEVTLPESLTTIEAGAFRSCTNLTKITLPENVTSIGSEAFYSCTSLGTVTFSKELTSIGSGAFSSCINLEKITFPENLNFIYEEAFSHCEKLERINIPKNLIKITNSAFVGCSNLTEFDVEPENPVFSEVDGVLLGDNSSLLHIFPEGYEKNFFEVPESIERVSSNCFSGLTHLKSLIIHNESVFDSYDRHHLDDLNVYYDGVEEITEDIKKKWKDWGANFINMNEKPELMEKDTLSIFSDSMQLPMGESMQLFPEISPKLVTDFIWTSSDENVAIVSETGLLIAVNPGTTTIQVKTADDRYLAEATFQVTGNAFAMEDYKYLELSEDLLQYTSPYIITKQIVSEKLHGIYFLNGNELSFYSLVTGKHQIIHTFEGCDSAYITDDTLYILYENICYTYDLLTRTLKSKFHIMHYDTIAVGADHQGRIYISAKLPGNYGLKKIFLYSPDGEKLSELSVATGVYEFSGFDSTNGCFYMESYYSFSSLGYSYPGRGLTMGKVTGNSLEYIETQHASTEGVFTTYLDCMLYLFQKSYMEHQTSTQLLGNKYLVAASAMHSSLNVMDSNSAGEKGIDTLLRVERVAEEEELENDGIDTLSIGTRAVYHEQNDSIIMYENNKTISEYVPTTEKKTATFQTQHKVFNLLNMGEHIIAIEKEDDKFYMEIINWKNPSEITLQTQNTEMSVGTLKKITPSYESMSTKFLNWSSSDKNVATVSQNGIVAAWNEGTAVITANIGNALTASITINVTPTQTIIPVENAIHFEGAETYNVSLNHYNVWSKVVNSYLVEKTDGTLEQIEDLGENGVRIKTYTKDLEIKSSKFIPMELELFGGFYEGENAKFVVFGEKNPTDSDEVEVLRIVKYSKDWERLDSVSIKGANTSIPFEGGSLRMTETDGILYIHTCHEMYMSEDGENHQANMTFVLNEESMEIQQSFYDVSNVIQAGYVSHSFNQFIQTDGEYVYRVDHGDGYPRAMALTKCKTDGKITDVSYIAPFAMQYSEKYNYNYTGATIGGFELSNDNCLMIGSSIDQMNEESFGTSKQFNIFLTVTNKIFTQSKLIWLTDYPEEYNTQVCTPHLIKLNEEQFLVMWEEVKKDTRETAVKMVTVNSDGEICSEIKNVANMELSDCKPILTSDGLVKWYVTDKQETIFNIINPYHLSAVKDDTHEAKENLYDIVSKGTDKVSTDYTADSWAVYEAAYTEAIRLLENKNATIKELVAAGEILENALNALVRVTKPESGEELKIAKEKLNAVIEKGAGKEAVDYTEESWLAYAIAHETAIRLLKREYVTIEEIIEAKEALETAMDNLMPKGGDENQGENEDNGDSSEGNGDEYPDSYADIWEAKKQLYDVVKIGMHKIPTDYTVESWTTYEIASNEAMILVNATSGQVTIKQIVAAKEKLENALNALVHVTIPEGGDENQGENEDNGDSLEGNGDEYPDSYADIEKAKKQLYDVVEIGHYKMPVDYTDESWAVYVRTSNEAMLLINTAFNQVTVKQLVAAKEKLEQALKELVPITQQDGQYGTHQKELELARKQLSDLINYASKEKLADYTAESWNMYEVVYNEAKRMSENKNATKEHLISLKIELQNALNALVPVTIQKEETPENKPKENIVLKPGKTFKNGNYKFKIKNAKEAIFTGVSKKISKVKIPNTVTYKGKVLKVTSVAAKALRNNKVVTKIIVGTNVTTIGKSAFEKCSKIQNITIKSTKLKTVQKKAFSGIKGNAKIKVPKKCRAKYKTLLKNAGYGKK